MKIKCPKCKHIIEVKNPIAVKGGQVTGFKCTDENKAKFSANKFKYWDDWHKEHGKTKVIRNRPGKPKLIPKKERDR